MNKRKLNESPKESPEERTKESEKLKEETMPSLEKIKFGKKAIDDVESIFSSNKETYSEKIMIVQFQFP